MSTQQFTSSTDGVPPRAGDQTKPLCPQCRRNMTVKQVSPVLFASGLDDVVYGCEDCGTKTELTVKRG